MCTHNWKPWNDYDPPCPLLCLASSPFAHLWLYIDVVPKSQGQGQDGTQFHFKSMLKWLECNDIIMQMYQHATVIRVLGVLCVCPPLNPSQSLGHSVASTMNGYGMPRCQAHLVTTVTRHCHHFCHTLSHISWCITHDLTSVSVTLFLACVHTHTRTHTAAI